LTIKKFNHKSVAIIEPHTEERFTIIIIDEYAAVGLLIPESLIQKELCDFSGL